MLEQEISISLWIFIILVSVTAVATIEWVFLPFIRFVLKRRTNRALAEISTHLKVGLRPLQLTKKQVVVDRLCYDPQVLETIDKYTKESGISRQKVEAEVQKYARETVPSFNAYIYQRVSYWFAKQLSWHLFKVRGRILNATKLMNVDSEATVVFVLNHRSNMDYILVSYLASRSTTISYAVGEWAKFWPLKSLIQSMGAFFVHRNSKNPLYRKVLERYVHMATKEGICQAVFPEGGLSKDGKLMKPKLGFIDYMLRSYNVENNRDIVFVPVGINFDRTIEDRSLTRKLDPKSPDRDLWFVIRTTIQFMIKNSLLRSAEERWKRFGYAGVNFGEPISLKKYCNENKVLFDQLDKNSRFKEVEKLATHLMDSIAQVIPILPVPLVATTILTAEKGLNVFDIKIGVHDLIEDIQKKGAPIRDSEKPQENTILHAIEMLSNRGVILKKEELYFPNQEEILILEYYANSIAHWTKNERSYRCE